MALFRKRKNSTAWNWDPGSSDLTGDQLWSLLTNAIYFHAAARRSDVLGGGQPSADWADGLAAWWDVHNEAEYEELVTWMTSGGGYREQWADRGVDEGKKKYAWDYCRLVTVSGGAALAGVISDDRAWDMVLHAGDELSQKFESWQAVGENYLAGRLLWFRDHGHGDDESQVAFETVANALVSDQESPWNRVTWDRSSGVVIDGVLRS